MHPTKLTGILLLALVTSCHSGGPANVDPEQAKSRSEEALAAALRWIPTNRDYQSLPVVLMAGDAHGSYRPAWVDSLRATGVIAHDCHAITVMECKDSARATYVGFYQPKLGEGHSAEVPMAIIVLNPASCSHDSMPYTQVMGQLVIPRVGGSMDRFLWTQNKVELHHC
jgi:hypothetical protein